MFTKSESKWLNVNLSKWIYVQKSVICFFLASKSPLSSKPLFIHVVYAMLKFSKIKVYIVPNEKKTLFNNDFNQIVNIKSNAIGKKYTMLTMSI